MLFILPARRFGVFSPGLDIGVEISSWGRRDDKGLRIEGLIPAQTSIAPNETDFPWKGIICFR